MDTISLVLKYVQWKRLRGPPRDLHVKLNLDPLKEFLICGDIKTLPTGETRKMQKKTIDKPTEREREREQYPLIYQY